MTQALRHGRYHLPGDDSILRLRPAKLSVRDAINLVAFPEIADAGAISSKTPDRSDPSVSGGRGLTLVLPSRMRAPQGPTPAAMTRTSSSPAAGTGRGVSSTTITSGGPEWWNPGRFHLNLGFLVIRKGV